LFKGDDFMKKWKAPEVFELRTEWTQNRINTPGRDDYAEEVELPDGTVTHPGSC